MRPDQPDPQRRALLRLLFLSGGMLSTGPLLSACQSLSTRDGATDAPRPMGELPLPRGPLADVGALFDSGVDGIFLPEGFSVRAVARHLSNPVTGAFDPLGLAGYNWHEAPDGGACFATDDGGWIYVSNSEHRQRGGVGALRFAPDGRIAAAYRILDHTRRNCAGGATPWQTWLSCEEVPDGQVYECEPTGTPETARVLPALGRFAHEAAAVDMPTRSVFLTEDTPDGRLYRFVADAEDVTDSPEGPRLHMRSGRLQVLNIQGFADDEYVSDDLRLRKLHATQWVDAIAPEQPQARLRTERRDARKRVPGTVFRGGEGMWIYTLPPELRNVPPGGTVPTRAVLFFATKGDNRVHALDVDNGLIETIFDNRLIDPVFDDVDNVVVSPAGDVVVAEDGEAMRLMVVVPNAPAKTLLQVRLGSDSELTGPAFSPDGSRLYFSSQRGPNLPLGKNGSGVTYEVTLPASVQSAFRAA